MNRSILQKPAAFFDRYERKPAQQETTHYCAGCGHGVLHRLLGEAIDALGVQDRTILVAPVGCAVFLYYYFNCSSISVPHGRAPAVATGIGRCDPNAILVSYQGDGDLAAIGTSNIIHAANRGENMLVLFVNNNTYGMTGGQLAPTTLVGQTTATSPSGRSLLNDGPPLRMAEIIATLGAPIYVGRFALTTPARIRQARKAVLQGLRLQAERKGFVFLEFLSACPTNWRLKPLEAIEWIESTVIRHFPLGVFKDCTADAEPQIRQLGDASFEKLSEHLRGAVPLKAITRPDPLPFPEVRFRGAGFGGQGVLSMGTVLAQCALRAGHEVTWLPSYGPEMRGGVANCTVVFGPEPVATPVIDRENILIALNNPSMEKFAPTVDADGIVVFNRSMIPRIPDGVSARVYGVDATDCAQALGDRRAANTVALGFAARVAGLFALPLMEAVLRDMFKAASVLQINLSALRQGWALGGDADEEEDRQG